MVLDVHRVKTLEALLTCWVIEKNFILLTNLFDYNDLHEQQLPPLLSFSILLVPSLIGFWPPWNQRRRLVAFAQVFSLNIDSHREILAAAIPVVQKILLF